MASGSDGTLFGNTIYSASPFSFTACNKFCERARYVLETKWNFANKCGLFIAAQ